MLATLLAFAFVPTFINDASAAESITIDLATNPSGKLPGYGTKTTDITYSYDSETKTLTFSPSSAEGAVNSAPDYYWATGAQPFHGLEDVDNVVFEEGITALGKYFFYECSFKSCSILEDGGLCKNCNKKLSPWFTGRRHCTVEGIKEQLAYREANKEEVAKFNVTRTVGSDYKIYLDEDNQKFFVTDARQWKDANPDVLNFSDVTGSSIDIQEYRGEEYRTDAEGNTVSYHPPRYYYDYNLYMELNVKHDYFDQIRFQLNTSSIREMAGPGGSAGMHSGEYTNAYNMGVEIKEVLEGARTTARETAAAAAAPKVAVTCRNCGASTIPDAAGCCEYCGGAV